MGDVTRRHAIRLATTAGGITAGTVALGAAEARADEDRPHDIGTRVELDDDEKRMVEEAERNFGHTKGREQQLPYGWTVPGIFDLNGIVHFSPGAEPYSDGTVTGLIYGTYRLTKAHPKARLYDDRVRNRLEIAMVLEEPGGGYVHARHCHRGLLGAWRCGPWHFLKGWYS